MSTTVETIYLGNDMVMDAENVRNALTGEALSAATVSLTLRDQANEALIGGESWPKAMTPVVGKPGSYRCTIPYSLVVANNQRLTATIEIDAGAGLRAKFEIPVVAKLRRE